MGLDNQQETFKAYIAGLFEGEGSIHMGKLLVNKSKTVSYRANANFTNTEPEICDAFVRYLKERDLHYHLETEKRKDGKNRKVCYKISLTRVGDRKRFVEELLPYFVGKKRREGEILIRFCEKRLEIYKNSDFRRADDGRYRSGCKSSFDDPEYEELLLEMKALKGSSETTCKTPVFITG
jgi:hypothetical protein